MQRSRPLRTTIEPSKKKKVRGCLECSAQGWVHGVVSHVVCGTCHGAGIVWPDGGRISDAEAVIQLRLRLVETRHQLRYARQALAERREQEGDTAPRYLPPEQRKNANYVGD